MRRKRSGEGEETGREEEEGGKEIQYKVSKKSNRVKDKTCFFYKEGKERKKLQV